MGSSREEHANRRNFHWIAGCLFAYLLLLSVTKVTAENSQCFALKPSPELTPFVDPLPIPEIINVSNGTQLVLGVYKITQKLHRDLPPTTLYAYGTSQGSAKYPGPTLKAMKNVETKVRWENHINDSEHIFVVDRTIHWADPPRGGVPMVVHLHGSEARSDYDGYPDGWFTAAGDHGHAFTTQDYIYPNEQAETMLWYHDHTTGMTRLNVVAGMAGIYLIKSRAEGRLPLPSGYGTFEVPLVFQDRSFWANGSINYPDTGIPNVGPPNWCPDYYGDTILVNGKVWPYLEVFQTKYRFRMLVGSNARFFNLSLSEPSLRFIQIGTDGGFLHTPMTLKTVTMGPGYRADVVIDFSAIPLNTTVFLNNSANVFFPFGNPNVPPETSPGPKRVMAFKVVAPPKGVRVPKFRIPRILASKPDTRLRPATDLHRNLTLNIVDVPLTLLLNNKRFMDPVTEIPKLGTTEIWSITNLAASTHPMHVHLVNFLMLDTQTINQTRYEEGNCSFSVQYPDPFSCYTGPRRPPDESQVGWKDTVIVYQDTVARLLIRWQPRSGGVYPFDPTFGPGYVWHCHMLDHEDNDMMRPLVLKRP